MTNNDDDDHDDDNNMEFFFPLFISLIYINIYFILFYFLRFLIQFCNISVLFTGSVSQIFHNRDVLYLNNNLLFNLLLFSFNCILFLIVNKIVLVLQRK